MRQGTGSRYAGPLAGAVGLVLLVAACGAAPAGAPTADGPTPAPAVTAPVPSSTATTAPGFSAAGGTPTGTGPTLTVTARATSAAPTTSASPAESAPPPAAGLRLVQALIPYPAQRQQEMAAYSLRHYGTASWQLLPTMIVLHYTAGGTWQSTRATFAADTTNMGEKPGTCAHFVVDRDGTVYQLVPTTVRCRHTIGLNDVAIGIEMVQDGGSSPAWADRQILDRPAQVGAALALVRSLQAQYGIATADVVGHATANGAPRFRDLAGWRNDHGDWQAADVAEFRSRL